MSPEVLGLFLLLALIIGIFVGFPIAFTLFILAFSFGLPLLGDKVFALMVLQTEGIMDTTVLAAVPLFVFMGFVLERAGLMERLFRSFQLMMAPVRGSLYLGLLVTSTLFAAATGIIGASVTVMGLMAAPSMIRAKYNVRLSAGAITAGGTLGILIPPSIMLVVMGPVMGISVVRLFAAAIVPGLILSGLYIAYAMTRSFINPELGPPLPKEERASSLGEIASEFFRGVLPLAVLIFAALGSILAGLATPTEAAAAAAVASILLVAAYRRLNFTLLKEACYKTVEISSLVLFLAVAAVFYGAVFSRLGSSSLITRTLLGLGWPPIIMLLLFMVVIFLLGWPLEWPAIIFIFLPIFMPFINEMGWNLVWIGALVAVNLQTAFLSPPVAMAAYYLKGVVPQWSLGDIYMGMLEFMILQVVGLLLVLFFPPTALWLPKVLFGS